MGALACAPLFFVSQSWHKVLQANPEHVWGMHSLILSFLVPLDALQAGGDALGDFTMCHTSII